MKLTSILWFLLLPVFAIAQVKPGAYVIKGQIAGLKYNQEAKVYLSVYKNGSNIYDSAKVVQGHFQFLGKIAEPGFAGLSIRLGNRAKSRISGGILNFFLEKGITQVYFPVDSVFAGTISGTHLNSEKQLFEQVNAKIIHQVNAAYKVYFKLEDLKRDSTQNQDALNLQIATAIKKVDSLSLVQFDAEQAYIRNHKGSFYSLWLLAEEYRHGLEFEQAKLLFGLLSADIKNTYIGKKMAAELAVDQKFANGQIAPNFLLPDTSGKLVSLAAMKGKYVLVDFWASWCVPCRQENPYVKDAWLKYHNKGLEIVGISQDFMKGNWINALNEDKLSWVNLIDTNGKVSKVYNIKAIPSNFLIDPQGKIVAKNLRGEALDMKLKDVFNN
jgi:peroxiredoxin